jgi:hypothetical protein
LLKLSFLCLVVKEFWRVPKIYGIGLASVTKKEAKLEIGLSSENRMVMGFFMEPMGGFEPPTC